MKNLFLILLLIGNLASAQTEVFQGFSVWSQRMDLSQYAGKKYRLTMAIRAEPSGTESAAFGFIRNEYPKMAAQNWTFMDNMNDRPVLSKNWGTYTLESTVDTEAPWLGFGFLNLGNGTFYYDDLHLSVESEPGVWSPIPIENGDFENETLEKELVDTSLDARRRKTAKLMLSQPNIPFKDLSAIQCPVLVLAGDRDWVKLEHVLKVFQSIPQSQLCIFPGADHRSVFTHQQLFLQLAGAFFEKPFAMPSTVGWFKE